MSDECEEVDWGDWVDELVGGMAGRGGVGYCRRREAMIVVKAELHEGVMVVFYYFC